LIKKIGVLGCGWLGLPLAESLLKKGYEVRGSSTRASELPALREKGIAAHRILLTENQIEGPIDGFLKGLDILVLNIPPGLRSNPKADFTARINLLLPELLQAGVPRVLFVSSTSVFGSSQGRVTEATVPIPDTHAGQQLLQAESMFLAESRIHSQILRLGGLLGADRHPVKYLSGKIIASGGNQRVNLISRMDGIAALETLISHPGMKGVYHAVYPEHPTKRDYYNREAAYLGIPSPEYQDPAGVPEGKQVGSDRLAASGFRFAYPIFSGNGPGI
jgi:nucleoside-diphosphate-sugar epimerase